MQRETYAPDWLDCEAIALELGQSFNLRCQVTAEVMGDVVEFVCRAYTLGTAWGGVVTFQALSRQKLKSVKPFPTTMYLLMFDIFQQADGGGATAAKRGPAYRWSGRVETPRRRR